MCGVLVVTTCPAFFLPACPGRELESSGTYLTLNSTELWAAKVGWSVVVPGGPPGFGSPSWRISGSAPQAELGPKRSSTRLICVRNAVISTKHNKAWEGYVARPGVDMSAHVPTFDTCALPRLGSLALVRMNLRLTRLPMHTVQPSHGREVSAVWAGSRGFQWIGSRA